MGGATDITQPVTANKLAEMYAGDVEERMEVLRSEQAYGLPEDAERVILEKLEHWEITLEIIRAFQERRAAEAAAEDELKSRLGVNWKSNPLMVLNHMNTLRSM